MVPSSGWSALPWMFLHFNHLHTPDSVPTEVIKSRPGTSQTPQGDSRLSHNQCEASSASVPASAMVNFLSEPVTPRIRRARQTDCPTKPLAPTSTGRQLAFHHFLWQSSTSSWYLARFLLYASSILCSQGKVNHEMFLLIFLLKNIMIRMWHLHTGLFLVLYFKLPYVYPGQTWTCKKCLEVTVTKTIGLRTSQPGIGMTRTQQVTTA